jgi:NAD(P)-dependent dehydrogenase (short-subunit alcohol dehydrogenase family)
VQEQERLRLVRADLFDEEAVAQVVAAAGADLRAVVNLVGGFAQHGRVHETPIATFEEQLRLNLRATYLVSQAAIPVLLAAGGGAIVCVSSRAALRPFPGAAGYVVGKAAVLALVDALDAEYRDDHIRVNAVLPSVIDTPANRAAMPDADFSRWVAPAEIAEVVRFLCSPEQSGPIAGAHVPVYGRA